MTSKRFSTKIQGEIFRKKSFIFCPSSSSFYSAYHWADFRRFYWVVWRPSCVCPPGPMRMTKLPSSSLHLKRKPERKRKENEKKTKRKRIWWRNSILCFKRRRLLPEDLPPNGLALGPSSQARVRCGRESFLNFFAWPFWKCDSDVSSAERDSFLAFGFIFGCGSERKHKGSLHRNKNRWDQRENDREISMTQIKTHLFSIFCSFFVGTFWNWTQEGWVVLAGVARVSSRPNELPPFQCPLRCAPSPSPLFPCSLRPQCPLPWFEDVLWSLKSPLNKTKHTSHTRKYNMMFSKTIPCTVNPLNQSINLFDWMWQDLWREKTEDLPGGMTRFCTGTRAFFTIILSSFLSSSPTSDTDLQKKLRKYRIDLVWRITPHRISTPKNKFHSILTVQHGRHAQFDRLDEHTARGTWAGPD